MDVDIGGLNAWVAQQILDGVDVHTGLELAVVELYRSLLG